MPLPARAFRQQPTHGTRRHPGTTEDPPQDRGRVFGRRRWAVFPPLQKPTGGDEFRDTMARGLISIKRNCVDERDLSPSAVNLLALRSRFNLLTCRDRAAGQPRVDSDHAVDDCRLRDRPHVLVDMMRRLIRPGSPSIQRLDWAAGAERRGPSRTRTASSRESRRLPTCKQLRCSE